jgi:hypothetical protein
MQAYLRPQTIGVRRYAAKLQCAEKLTIWTVHHHTLAAHIKQELCVN